MRNLKVCKIEQLLDYHQSNIIYVKNKKEREERTLKKDIYVYNNSIERR